MNRLRLLVILLVVALVVTAVPAFAAFGDEGQSGVDSDGWFGVHVEDGQEVAAVSIGKGMFDYKTTVEGLVLSCSKKQARAFQETTGVSWMVPLLDRGRVTGPCNAVIMNTHTHFYSGGHDHDHDHDDDDPALLWRPTIRYTFNGKAARQSHDLGQLAPGKWRVRNFGGVRVAVLSSENGWCKQSMRARFYLVVGGDCGGTITLRVRNKTAEPYRLWVTKLD